MHRYKVVEGSHSAHCCFQWTVVDTSRPEMTGDGEQYVGRNGPEYEAVCECVTWEDADNICTALNYCEDMT